MRVSVGWPATCNPRAIVASERRCGIPVTEAAIARCCIAAICCCRARDYTVWVRLLSTYLLIPTGGSYADPVARSLPRRTPLRRGHDEVLAREYRAHAA